MLDTAIRPNNPSHTVTGRPPAIVLDRLAKTYGRGAAAVRAVDDVSLSVPAGQAFALLGPNGAGKTTLIKMMSGLVTPTSGTAQLNDYDITRQRSAAVELWSHASPYLQCTLALNIYVVSLALRSLG